jgi:hypothetical protein
MYPEIINAFQGKEAVELYNKLITKKTEGNWGLVWKNWKLGADEEMIFVFAVGRYVKGKVVFTRVLDIDERR